MTVTINDVMPQEKETTVEREVGNNIVNNGNVGIEMGNAAGEAEGMGVQSSDRQRKEKERKRKYRARKAGPVDVIAKIVISPKMKHAKYDRTYQSKEHVKERDAEEKRNRYQSTKTAQQAGPVDVSAKIASQQMKRSEKNRTYQSKKHVKERHAKNKRNTRHSIKVAQQAADVDGIIKATKKKDDDNFKESRKYNDHKNEDDCHHQRCHAPRK